MPCGKAINRLTVDAWRRRDEAILLLRLNRCDCLPRTITRYLDSAAGRSRERLDKCRNRDPWYVVPDVSVPHAFVLHERRHAIARCQPCELRRYELGPRGQAQRENGDFRIAGPLATTLDRVELRTGGTSLGGRDVETGTARSRQDRSGHPDPRPKGKRHRLPKDWKSCADGDTMAKAPAICQWISLKQALAAFAENVSGHQGSGHIKPLHWYVSCRLVVEGGFHPDDITPHPPFVVSDRDGRHVLQHVPNKGASVNGRSLAV